MRQGSPGRTMVELTPWNLWLAGAGREREQSDRNDNGVSPRAERQKDRDVCERDEDHTLDGVGVWKGEKFDSPGIPESAGPGLLSKFPRISYGRNLREIIPETWQWKFLASFHSIISPRILCYFPWMTDRTKSTPNKLPPPPPPPDFLGIVRQSVTWRELFTSFVPFDETRFDDLQGENSNGSSFPTPDFDGSSLGAIVSNCARISHGYRARVIVFYSPRDRDELRAERSSKRWRSFLSETGTAW